MTSSETAIEPTTLPIVGNRTPTITESPSTISHQTIHETLLIELNSDTPSNNYPSIYNPTPPGTSDDTLARSSSIPTPPGTSEDHEKTQRKDGPLKTWAFGAQPIRYYVTTGWQETHNLKGISSRYTLNHADGKRPIYSRHPIPHEKSNNSLPTQLPQRTPTLINATLGSSKPGITTQPQRPRF